MALLSVELHRAAARRLVRVPVVPALVGAVLLSVLYFANSEKLPASRAGGPASATATTGGPAAVAPGAGTPVGQSCVTTSSGTGCTNGSGFSTDAASKEFRLTDLYLSKAEQQHRDLERFGNKPKNVLMFTTVLFILMGLIADASFIGAEYKAGTIGTLLTWEPRRLRVLAAKLAAAAITAALVYLAFQVVLLNLKPAWRPWSLIQNLSALINGAGVILNHQVRSPGAATVIIGGYVAAAVLVTGAVFIRDIA
jgi:hypothetical protein